jgi:hypothetical protein
MSEQSSVFRGTVAAIFLIGASGAYAQSTAPTYNSFAMLSNAELAVINFGGTGISEYGPVALGGNSSFSMALAATPRVSGAYVGPAVTNNGTGTYIAQIGESPAAGSNNATWNYNFAIVGNTSGLTFRLFADVDPGVGTTANQYLNVSLLLGAGAAGGSNQSTQDSQNLGFGDSVVFPGWPNYSFNPNVVGEYNFALLAYDSQNSVVDEVAIRVTVVPEPEAYGMALAGMGVVGFAMFRRRRAPAA